MTFVTPKVRASRAVLLLALVSLLVTACGRQNPYGNNQPPTVNAGVDQQVNEGSAVTLSGSASDADGQIARVQWQQTAGPEVTLVGATTLILRFDAPAVNARTELRFRLSATDNKGAVRSDEVIVSIGDAPLSNRLPEVNAGLDQSVTEGATVTFNGAASDEDGTITALQWTQTAGPDVTLTGADTASASFTAPAVSASTVLTFKLTATDNAGGSSSDLVNITVQDQAVANRAPVADAGPDQNVDEGSSVTLLGSGRDDDGSIASHQWTQISGPAVTLSDANAARPSFTAPQVTSDSALVFELVVTDNLGAASAADRSTITVRNLVGGNQPPVALAGADQTVNEGVAVSLNGGNSNDPDGTVQSFAWTQIDGPSVTLTGGNTATASFTAPLVNANTTLSFRLTVTDNGGATASDTVAVQVQDLPAGNLVPTANAGPDQNVNEGTAVSLPGSASDADGTVASVVWSQVSGAVVTLANASSNNASFTAPSVTANSTLVFRFTATDNQGATASDEVAVLVRDTAVVAAACTEGRFCVGSAKRSISPSDVQIAGIDEPRLGGQTTNQTFHLGGFGIGPLDAFGPFNDFIANPAATRATHCKGLRADCEDADRERTWVRAIYLGQPDASSAGTRVLFVTIDATGAGNLVQRDVTAAISAETGVPAENILFGQTHTHAGADLQGLWGGVPQDWVQNVLISQAVAAAKEAQLNARQSEVTYAMARDSAFNNYRRPRQTDPLADSDDRLSVLQARDSLGAVLATLVQYTAHPTAIGTGSGGELGRVPHPDYPLGLEDKLEDTFGATAVYYNGAIADASGSGPTTGDDDYARVRSRGECLAKSVLTALNPAMPQQCSFSLLNPAEVIKMQLAPTLAVRHATAILPVTNPVFVAGAGAGAFNRYYDFTMLPLASIPGIGPALAAQQTNLPQVAPTASTRVSRITIGGAESGLEIVTIPGEATNTFGQSIRRLTTNPNMMLMGLTHNSFGYIIPEEEFSYINASGDAGFVAPFTGYEEFVSLGPLTAPMLRQQGYNPLFDVAAVSAGSLPPSLQNCESDPTARDCGISQTLYRLDYIQNAYAETCRDNLAANAPAELKDAANSFCALLDPDTPLAQPCRDAGGPEGLCAVLGDVPITPPPADADSDGVMDADDRCPASPADSEVDARGCTTEQANADADGDGVKDPDDQCAATPSGVPVDAEGCPVGAGDNASCTSQQNLAGNRSYAATIPSESGETISFQVLEPSTFNCAGRAQGAHPLILHSHGFGGARSTSGFANYRDAGYAVISIDQRGFGLSSGTVRVMDPDFEGKDLIRILDWAEQNLDYLAWRNEGAMKMFAPRPVDGLSVDGGVNLLVGAIGSSYGGGYQLLLQNVDPKNRLDAMAPDIAWHDLRWSLNPGDVIKTGWDLLLVAGGAAGSYGPGLQNGELPTQRGLDPFIMETLARGASTGEFPREALEWFRYHSPAYWCDLNGEPAMPYAVAENTPFDPNMMLMGLLDTPPGSNARTGQTGIPVLLSQGMRDTLFNFNDGWWNYQCMAKRGDDVRLITHQSGHLLPIAQPASGNNDCGSRKRGDATLEWFGEKLRGSNEANMLKGTEDSVCLSLTDGDAVDIPVDEFLAPRAESFERPLLGSYTAIDDVRLTAVPQGAPAVLAFAAPLPLPQVAELFTVREGQSLILGGIPQASITLSSPQMVNDLACATAGVPTLRTGCDAVVFVGLGLKKAGASSYTLIDDQVLPVRGLGSHAVSLVGIGERLAAGDALALLVYGYHPQYLINIGRDPTLPVVNVAADLQLPLYGADTEGKPDFEAVVADAINTGTPPAAAGSGLPLCAPLLGCLSEVPVVGEPLQGVVDMLADAAGLSGTIETVLAAQAAEALLRGCDLLDPAHCLYPFPSDHFTVAAAAGSLQSTERGGTGRRVNFNPLAMPRNVFGKGIDPTEWNRNDGFSPGSMLITYVPNLATVKNDAGAPTGPITGAVPLTDLPRYLDADAPVLVIDADTGERHPVWAEIDLNAGQLIPAVPEAAGIASPFAKRPALIIRPGSNFVEGHRYIAVLRNLRDEADAVIPAQSGFAACRDGDSVYAALPPVAERCATLDETVFPALERAGIARDDSLYLAWDFTIASAENHVARLRHLRDDAFGSLGEQGNPGTPDYVAGRAPDFVVTEVIDNPDDRTVRRVRGTITVPSYVIPADPSPLDGEKDLQDQLQALARQCDSVTQGNCEIPGVASVGDGFEVAASGSLPPNRLFYSPADNAAPTPDASNLQDPTGLRYGDGLPDRNPQGDLTTTFTCNIPRSALPVGSDMTTATAADVRPVRPTVYGHGLLGGQGEVNGQASDFGNRYGLMNCAMDWFGFATGDVPNVATVLVDLSNFPVIPDGSQQGMLNQMFLARLAVHADGFAAHPAFQVQERPVFDRREVFYHGNSQGGILGGTLLSASKDLNRGMLGVPGMNYSTLLSRSTDFALYSIPFYLAYPSDLDRPLNFALMQMLWDRSENNGYAAHLTDNTAMGGPANQVLLHPAFGDHQVTMWTVDVMARSLGARVDARRVLPARHPDVDGAEYALLDALDYDNPVHAAGSALVPLDQKWNSTGDGRCRNNENPAPPIGNVPPGDVGDDPHECPRRDNEARCQMSHFLLRSTGLAEGDTAAALINPARVTGTGDTAAECPPVVITGAPVTAGSYTPPAESPFAGLLSGLGTLGDTLSAVLGALMAGDFEQALALLQGGANEQAETTIAQASAAAGAAAGLTLPPPAQDPDPALPAAQPLMAGIAKGAVRIPVGTPLGGYLRPPVGGEYLPGLEAFAGGDPSKFFAELIDFLPTEQDHDGLPLAALPDELRKLHSPYATYSPPSRGYYDSLVAKAVALYDGNDYVVLVKTDFIGMLDELVQGVADKVQADTVSAAHPQGIDLHDGLIMSASHSHDGPGAVGNHSIRYFWLAIDAYQPEVYERAVNDLAKVVTRAVQNLQPAKIGHAMGREGFEHPVRGATQLNGYRRARLPSYNIEDNDDVRRRLGLLRIDKLNGEPLAVVMNFAVHGIAFDVENQYFSGDVPGALERSTEQLLNLPLAMMVQNTGGDISPRGVDNDNKLQRIESFGELFAPQVQAIYGGIDNFQTEPDLRTVSQRIILNRERLGYLPGEFPYAWGGAQCNNDIAAPFVGGGPGDIPGYNDSGLPRKITQCIPATPPDAIDLADNGVGENGAFVPQDTRLTAAMIGDITLLAAPGEPLTEYGVRLLNVADDEGYTKDDTFIWGYSQDHVGYIVAPEKDDWAMGGTEGTTTFWGWKQGQRFLDVQRELLIALRDGKAAPADEFQVNYFYEQYYQQQPGAPVIPSPRPGRVVGEPGDIARFATTSFAWEGGDPVIDSPEVLLEQEVAGSWQPARRANGEVIDTLFEMHLKYRLLTGAHVWTLDFEAPKDWPVGRYRFSVSGIARQAADTPYALSSQPFSVAPSESLVLSAPVVNGSNIEVTLAYAPRPDNYRVIDALVLSDVPAPVRRGRVLFSNGSAVVEDAEPTIEVREGRLVAVYRAALSGTVTASGSDVYGNLSAGGSTPPVADAGPDRGSGVLGVLADFFASLNGVIASLGNGDPAAAGAQLQAALTTLGEELAEALFTGETGLIALLTHFGERLADGDPQGAGTGLDRDLGAFAGLDTSISAALQRSGSAARHVEAVVMTGNQLPGWSAPSAQGAPYPYPSGATISGQLFDPTPIPGQVRDAHNGMFFYPAGWVPGDEPVAGIGAPVDDIAAYAYVAGEWKEIPVQVDERYPFFLANSGSDFSVYSGTDEELSYAWDKETWNPGESADGCSAVSPPGVPDPVGGLDDDDEVTFMAADAGDMAPQGALPPGVPAGSAAQLVTLADPLATSPDSIAPRFVYLFQKPGGSAFKDTQHYVNYTRAPDADQWIDRTFFADDDPEKIGTSNTGYGANLSGSVCHPVDGKKNSNDRFPRDGLTVTTDTYLWKATGRWMVREISIRKPDQPGLYGQDLIDRWKGRAFQQSPDSTISLVGFEDEQVNWEANSSLLGERCGPVRCMREVWGADSGTNVTKTETFYRDAVISRYHVRVHPIPPDGLYTSWDYNRSAMLPTAAEKAAGMQAGRYYTALRPQGVPVDGINDDFGQIDSVAPIAGMCITSDGPEPAQNGRCPAFLDVADSTFNLPLAFNNWEQVAGKGDLGSMVYTFELKGATSLATPLVVPYYRDDACLDDGTGDDPVKRPWPGEASTDSRVVAGYKDLNGDGVVGCDEKQGAFAAHGIHYFATGDVDNAFVLGKPINEIDGQQWQFMVPTATPTNVGEPYSNVARFPLRAVATPLP